VNLFLIWKYFFIIRRKISSRYFRETNRMYKWTSGRLNMNFKNEPLNTDDAISGKPNFSIWTPKLQLTGAVSSAASTTSHQQIRPQVSGWGHLAEFDRCPLWSRFHYSRGTVEYTLRKMIVVARSWHPIIRWSTDSTTPLHRSQRESKVASSLLGGHVYRGGDD
jgi:hypothetical protein